MRCALVGGEVKKSERRAAVVIAAVFIIWHLLFFFHWPGSLRTFRIIDFVPVESSAYSPSAQALFS